LSDDKTPKNPDAFTVTLKPPHTAGFIRCLDPHKTHHKTPTNISAVFLRRPRVISQTRPALFLSLFCAGRCPAPCPEFRERWGGLNSLAPVPPPRAFGASRRDGLASRRPAVLSPAHCPVVWPARRHGHSLWCLCQSLLGSRERVKLYFVPSEEHSASCCNGLPVHLSCQFAFASARAPV